MHKAPQLWKHYSHHRLHRFKYLLNNFSEDSSKTSCSNNVINIQTVSGQLGIHIKGRAFEIFLPGISLQFDTNKLINILYKSGCFLCWHLLGVVSQDSKEAHPGLLCETTSVLGLSRAHYAALAPHLASGKLGRVSL